LITLASAAWKLGLEQTLEKLTGLGLNVPVEALDRRQAAGKEIEQLSLMNGSLKFWTSASERGQNGAGKILGPLFRRWWLDAEMRPERWMTGPGHLLGVATTAEAEQLLRITRARTTPRFKGRNWGHLLTVPYWDLPGRIRAFAFLGRNGDRGVDEAFCRLPGYGIRAAGNEAGLAGLDLLLDHPSPNVVAVGDWMLLLQIQMRNFRVSGEPLPMVAWYDDGAIRTQTAWNALGTRRPVFWSMTGLDPFTIRQAAEQDALLSLAGPVAPTSSSINHYFRLNQGRDLIRVICKLARPWAEVVRAWLLQNPDYGPQLWQRLEEIGADVSYLLRRVDAGCNITPPHLKSLKIGSLTVVERGDRWYSRRNSGREEEISDTVLRILAIVKDRRTEESFYVGEIAHRGMVAPFVEAMETIEHKAFRWMQARMVDLGLGVPLCQKMVRNQLYDVAIGLHRPKLVIDDLVKWVQAARDWKLPTEQRVPLAPALPVPADLTTEFSVLPGISDETNRKK
jgi:hypothetical protein